MEANEGIPVPIWLHLSELGYPLLAETVSKLIRVSGIEN